MENNKGRQEYGIFLNNEQLRRDAMQSKALLRGIGDAGVAEGARIDNSYKRITGTMAALGGTVALGAMAKGLYDFANAFDKSMKEVATISDTVTNNIEGFKQQILELGTKVPIAADAAGKALYQIVSAGYDGADGMNLLEVSAKSAIAGMTDTTTAADAITTLLNAYKMSAGDAANISDQLFMTAKLGKTTFGELGQSISQAAPIAASYGVEVEQVLAAVATLTKSGTPTAQAMTQIRAAIIGVSKYLGDGAFEAMSLQEALNFVAKKANGSEKALRGMITEVEGVTGLLGLTGINAQMAASDLAALGGAAGETEKAFAKMSDTADAQMTILKNNMLRKFHEVGVGAVDIVGDMAKFLNNAFETGAIDDIIATVGVLIATLGVYKAQLLVVNAVKLVGNNLMYSAEIAELQKLLPAKEASKNADLEAAVAKGQLSQKRAEELIAIRAAVQARLEELRAIAATAQVEAQAAAIAHKAALQKALSSKSLVVQRQMELSLAKLSGDASKIELAEKSLLEAQEQRHIAVKARKATANSLSIAQSKASSATTAVDTMQQGINTAATGAATKAKTLMTIATGKLTTAFKAMGAAFKANPFGLILTAITLVTTATSLFKKEIDETSGKFGEFALKTRQEESTFKDLKTAIEQTSEGTQERADVIKLINDRYPDYLDSMLTEKSRTEDIITALTTANVKMLENIKLKLKQTQLEGILKKQLDAETKFTDKQINGFSDNNNSPEQIALFTQKMASLVEKAREGKATIDDARSVLIALGEDEKRVNTAIISSDNGIARRIRDIYGGFLDIKKAADEAGSSKQIMDALLKTINPELDSNSGDNGSNDEGSGDDSSNNKKSKKDYTDQLKREQQEKERFYTDMELTVRQAEINAMDEGVDKVLVQNQLNYDKEIEQIKRQKEDKLAKIQEWERTIWESQNPDYEKKGLKFKPQTTELSKDENQQFDTMEVSAKTTLATGNKKAYETELNDYATFAQSYLDKVMEFENNLKILSENQKQQRENLIKNGASKAEIEQFNQKARQEVDAVTAVQTELLAGLDEQMEIKSQTFILFAEQIANMGIEELKLKLDEAEQLLTEAQNTAGSEGNQSSVIEYQAQIRVLKQQITALAKKSDKKEDETSGNALTKHKAALKTVNELGSAAKDIAGAFEGLDGDIFSVMDSIGTMSSSVGSMLSTIVLMSTASQLTIAATTGAANAGIVTTSTTASVAIQGVEKASVILAIIGAALQIIQALAKAISGLFNDDKKKEKEIKRLQEQVDALEVSYDKLGEAIDEAYSFDASQMIKQQNEMLEQQKELIRLQIEQEKAKKKTDNGKIKEWEDQLNELDKTIGENEKAAVEAINGTSIKSAIEEFADAYVDAWAAGENKAASMKDVVRKMVKSAVTELIKSRLSPEVTAFMNFLAKAMEDGVMTIAEQQTLDALESSIYNKLDGLDSSLDKYIIDKVDEKDDREASKRGIATASQESVDENNGRLTAIQGHTYELNENVKLMAPNIAGIRESINFIRDNAAQQLEALYGIRNNTAPIGEMKLEMKYMRDAIEDIRDKGIIMR